MTTQQIEQILNKELFVNSYDKEFFVGGIIDAAAAILEAIEQETDNCTSKKDIVSSISNILELGGYHKKAAINEIFLKHILPLQNKIKALSKKPHASLPGDLKGESEKE